MADAHFERTRLDVVGVHGKELVHAAEGDRDDIDLRLDRQEKCSGKEGLNAAVGGAPAFRKDNERHTVFQRAQRGFDLSDGARGVLLIYADLPRALQMPADDGIRQQLFLVKNAELKRQIGVERRNIERGGVIDGIHVRLGGIDLIKAEDAHGRKNRLHNETRPGTGEGVKTAAVAIEKTKRNRSKAEADGIEPDQRIEKEIRAQAAEQAITPGRVLHNAGCRLLGRPDRRLRLERFGFKTRAGAPVRLLPFARSLRAGSAPHLIQPRLPTRAWPRQQYRWSR